MRVNFELKFGAETLEEAKNQAYQEAAKFLNMDVESVKSAIDMELKFLIPDAEKDKQYVGHFVVVAYGTVKHNVVRPV